MFLSVLAQTAVEFQRPAIDWHALAPELVLLAAGSLLILLDVIGLDRTTRFSAMLTGMAFLAPLVPIATLAIDGVAGEPRVLFGGSYVVDGYSLAVKAMFLLIGYIVVMLATQYIAEGDYWESEFYTMLSTSVLGMLIMASSRDLITIFVALELLSIPAYLLAAWRKRDLKSNEAGLKYYLMGVFASAIMLYGMSLVFGVTGNTRLTSIREVLAGGLGEEPAITLGIIFVIVGFAFKVSAFPFHMWAPDTYEGAPTPVTAFLAVATKAAGFVALINLIVVGFIDRDEVYKPVIFMIAAASMFAGNFMALRQTNIVRMMAYSGVAQAGFMLAPLIVVGESPAIAQSAVTSIVTYMVIYAAMNLGVFGVIMTVARRTRSGELESMNGLFSYAPGLAVLMTLFVASLAGIPPLGGWFAKFGVFKALIEADSGWGYSLAVIAALNTVIAAAYYFRLTSRMWFDDPAEDADTSSIAIPAPLMAGLAICVIGVLAFGVYPESVTHFTDVGIYAAGR